ncbi:MAG: hypothetical protein K8R60_18605 [Burkholderiales bacterium]|nr:hypothetical protein [Burkholderiales bacterium]
MTHRTGRFALALGLALAASAASAQSWNYESTKKGGRGKAAGETAHGVVTLEERDGKAFFRLVGGPDNLCLRGEMPAKVTRTAETTTIEPQSSLPDCEAFRLVIRNDGSGGERETRRGDAWIPGKNEHGLTPIR